MPLRGLTAAAFSARVLDASPDLHLLTTAEGVHLFASQAATTLIGWAPEDMVGQPPDHAVHPEDVPLVVAGRSAVLAGAEGPSRVVHRMCTPDGDVVWVESWSRILPMGDATCVVSSVRDVGERQRAEADLRRLATTDPLTGIANRTVFHDRIAGALARMAHDAHRVAVILIDVDHFKRVNDSAGHVAGDQVLCILASRFTHEIRPGDTLARLGGDEFGVVMEQLDHATDVARIARRLVEVSRMPIALDAHILRSSVSVGVAVSADPLRSVDDLLRGADRALYRAKSQGRGRAVLRLSDWPAGDAEVVFALPEG